MSLHWIVVVACCEVVGSWVVVTITLVGHELHDKGQYAWTESYNEQ